MPGRRKLRILALLSAGGTTDLATQRLCDVCAQSTGTTGAGLMLMSGEVSRGSICTTDATSALIEQLQYDLGEGPCIDAHHRGGPVLEPDLETPETPRWLGFSGPALAAGARAVFGFPMRVGAVRLGAMNLYNDASGHLSDDQHADALVMADVAAESVLLLQAGARPGTLASELAVDADFRYVVHQAAGMVAAQLRVSIADAHVRLRAHAFGSDATLTSVAEQVVARTLRFAPDAGTQGTA
ncbi:MAG: GAF and ANTAR domain-containing protein [Microthrixaceae bacterium]